MVLLLELFILAVKKYGLMKNRSSPDVRFLRCIKPSNDDQTLLLDNHACQNSPPESIIIARIMRKLSPPLHLTPPFVTATDL
jgi:hypothetical protein